ncbi:MAG TPA: sigma-70 family RNA polymerase sigma factor, partial [Gemmataceae bacterium]|nr:sigma-70 family RNA polymerase sigma factor [Gemmataceae bacterium]
MGSGPLTSVLRHLHRLLAAPGAEAPDDAQLLQRFARERDQHAFAALVQRHGALVWGVCRRVLGHEQDAEDAFQATFLVLARKAGTVRRQEALGAWLYEVAYHVALKARAAAARRRQHEREAGTMPRPDGSDEQLRQEVRRVLDEELHRLPPRYRRLLVLCDLQGRTHQEAARELGLPPGSVSRHLGRGRELLRERLVRRHGPMVLGAVRRALGQEQDAEDAFQATFLVLARKAGAIGKRESVGSWLYKVAY